MKRTTIYDCSVVELPRIYDPGGNITPIHGQHNIPFNISRVFYLYDIPGGESRGAHAHKSCHQFIIAASGSFEVFLDDGENKRTVLLNRPYYGLHVPPGIWAAQQSFSSGSICLVLASENYDEADYIRDYEEFLKIRTFKSYMKFLDLQKVNAVYATDLKRIAAEVIDSGWYLLGKYVKLFEEQLSSYLDCKYAVATGNGLDALRLILRAYIERGLCRREMKL